MDGYDNIYIIYFIYLYFMTALLKASTRLDSPLDPSACYVYKKKGNVPDDVVS